MTLQNPVEKVGRTAGRAWNDVMNVTKSGPVRVSFDYTPNFVDGSADDCSVLPLLIKSRRNLQKNMVNLLLRV